MIHAIQQVVSTLAVWVGFFVLLVMALGMILMIRDRVRRMTR